MAINGSLSKLEAVNIILGAIGQSPVNTLSGAQPAAVDIAEQNLDLTSLDVQMKGWKFNTRYNVELQPDTETKKIPIPSNILRVEPYQGSWDVSPSDGFLYDRRLNTFEFQRSFKAQLVYFYEWDLLPPSARTYIARRAALAYQATTLGDSGLDATLLRELKESQHTFETYEALTEGSSVLDSELPRRTLRRGIY